LNSIAKAISPGALALRLGVLILAGCALRHKPAAERITVTSIPAGAQTTVLGREYVTPATIKVPRDKPLTICVAAPGYAARTIYDDTMNRWKYFHQCFQGEADCRANQSVPTTTHVLTDINVRLQPCSSTDVCPKCSG
jgi:hypothetical protein